MEHTCLWLLPVSDSPHTPPQPPPPGLAWWPWAQRDMGRGTWGHCPKWAAQPTSCFGKAFSFPRSAEATGGHGGMWQLLPAGDLSMSRETPACPREAVSPAGELVAPAVAPDWSSGLTSAPVLLGRPQGPPLKNGVRPPAAQPGPSGRGTSPLCHPRRLSRGSGVPANPADLPGGTWAPWEPRAGSSAGTEPLGLGVLFLPLLGEEGGGWRWAGLSCVNHRPGTAALFVQNRIAFLFLVFTKGAEQGPGGSAVGATSLPSQGCSQDMALLVSSSPAGTPQVCPHHRVGMGPSTVSPPPCPGDGITGVVATGSRSPSLPHPSSHQTPWPFWGVPCRDQGGGAL